MFMVILALLEYISVSYMTKHIQKKKEGYCFNGRILGFRPVDVDIVSRLLFPIMFLCFHLVYFVTCMSQGQISDDLIIYEPY